MKLILKDGDIIKINLKTGLIENLRNKKIIKAEPFSDVQYEVYQKGGLIGNLILVTYDILHHCKHHERIHIR